MRQKINHGLIILVGLWLIVQGILLYKNGIVTTGEPPKYIEQAGNLLTSGHLSSPNFWLYATQIILIAIALKLKLGFVFVVGVQLILNLIATWCLYRFVADSFSRKTAVLCTALFILNYPLQEFNTFLQTESVFYSVTIIFSLYLLSIKAMTAKRFILLMLLLMLICFTRPTGLLFVPPAFLYLFFRFFKGIRFMFKIITTVGVTIIFLFFLNIAIGSGGELDFMLPFRDERIICGVPTLPYFKDIQTAENSNSLYGLLYYTIHNFGQFCNLAFRRSLAFFGLLRYYYSQGHNIYLGGFFYSIYALIIFSIRYWIKKAPYPLTYFLLIAMLTWATVILTCDDWHNRFFLTVSPYFIIMAGPAFTKFLSKFAPDDKIKTA